MNVSGQPSIDPTLPFLYTAVLVDNSGSLADRGEDVRRCIDGICGAESSHHGHNCLISVFLFRKHAVQLTPFAPGTPDTSSLPLEFRDFTDLHESLWDVASVIRANIRSDMERGYSILIPRIFVITDGGFGVFELSRFQPPIDMFQGCSVLGVPVDRSFSETLASVFRNTAGEGFSYSPRFGYYGAPVRPAPAEVDIPDAPPENQVADHLLLLVHTPSLAEHWDEVRSKVAEVSIHISDHCPPSLSDCRVGVVTYDSKLGAAVPLTSVSRLDFLDLGVPGVCRSVFDAVVSACAFLSDAEKDAGTSFRRPVLYLFTDGRCDLEGIHAYVSGCSVRLCLVPVGDCDPQTMKGRSDTVFGHPELSDD